MHALLLNKSWSAETATKFSQELLIFSSSFSTCFISGSTSCWFQPPVRGSPMIACRQTRYINNLYSRVAGRQPRYVASITRIPCTPFIRTGASCESTLEFRQISGARFKAFLYTVNSKMCFRDIWFQMAWFESGCLEPC